MPANPVFHLARRRALRHGLATVAGGLLGGCGNALGTSGAASAPATLGARTPSRALPPGSAQRPARLRLLAYAELPPRLRFAETPVGGLSGIDFDPASGDYWLLSDDRSELAPARVYRAQWRWPEAPRITATTPLRRADGRPWPRRAAAEPGVPVPDPEAIRLRPGTDTVLWTSEGDLARGFGPVLYESHRDGRWLREIAVPPMFAAGDASDRGPRDNLGFEGLALTPDGRGAWLAMEAALRQDGPFPTFDGPAGACRFTLIELASGRAARQIAYPPDAIPQRPVLPGGPADNGVSEVLMIDAHRMLVLERAYALGRGNSLRLYEIDTRRASDTLAIATLVPGNHAPVQKSLVADFAALGLPRLDNIEGLCWGPPLPDGARTLVALSDDNFNPAQVTQLAAFAYHEADS